MGELAVWVGEAVLVRVAYRWANAKAVGLGWVMLAVLQLANVTDRVMNHHRLPVLAVAAVAGFLHLGRKEAMYDERSKVR